MSPSKLGRWVARAERGESFVYGVARGRVRPSPLVMTATRALQEKGLVALVQRREAAGAIAYVAQRTWKKDGEA